MVCNYLYAFNSSKMASPATTHTNIFTRQVFYPVSEAIVLLSIVLPHLPSTWKSEARATHTHKAKIALLLYVWFGRAIFGQFSFTKFYRAHATRKIHVHLWFSIQAKSLRFHHTHIQSVWQIQMMFGMEYSVWDVSTWIW